MTQLALPLAADRRVSCSWVQSTPDLALPASTPAVTAPRFDVLRDGVVRDSRPAGFGCELGDVARGCVAWVECDGARWRAVEVW